MYRRRVHIVVKVGGGRRSEGCRDWSVVVVAVVAVVDVAVVAGHVQGVAGSQDFVHEGDVGDGQAEGLDAGETFFVSKRRDLKNGKENEFELCF